VGYTPYGPTRYGPPLYGATPDASGSTTASDIYNVTLYIGSGISRGMQLAQTAAKNLYLGLQLNRGMHVSQVINRNLYVGRAINVSLEL
jgi:hypothetical protein